MYKGYIVSSKTNYAIKVTYGIFIPQNDLILSVNYTHTVSYKTGEKRMIYKPLEEYENVFESKELPIGAPVKKTSEIISFEYRQFLGNNFAINPKYSYDFKNKVSGIELPLYFLQSKNVFSAGESFTYSLQALNRTTVVGEITAGGAHLTRPVELNNRFIFYVPFGRAINPITGTNWEGVGVKPDIIVDAADALDVALKLLF